MLLNKSHRTSRTCLTSQTLRTLLVLPVFRESCSRNKPGCFCISIQKHPPYCCRDRPPKTSYVEVFWENLPNRLTSLPVTCYITYCVKVIQTYCALLGSSRPEGPAYYHWKEVVDGYRRFNRDGIINGALPSSPTAIPLNKSGTPWTSCPRRTACVGTSKRLPTHQDLRTRGLVIGLPAARAKT